MAITPALDGNKEMLRLAMSEFEHLNRQKTFVLANYAPSSDVFQKFKRQYDEARIEVSRLQRLLYGESSAEKATATRLNMRQAARRSATVAYKRRKFAAGLKQCELCAWQPPAKMENRTLHAHHILPVSCGGSDEDENLVLLCANCHGIAHASGAIRKTGIGTSVWTGPKTKADLFDLLEARPA